MPVPTPEHDPKRLVQLLRELRTGFDGLRQRERPIRISLIHRATNAEAEGVTGHPSLMGEPSVAFLGAGRREARLNRNPDGTPRFIDPPVVGANGKPIIDRASGKGVDFTVPATRIVELQGDHDAVARLRSLAERGGRLAAGCRNEILHQLTDYRFRMPEELWWALVFELAWSGRHPLLSATRYLWRTGEKGELVRLPYDLEQLCQLAASPFGVKGKVVPEPWLKRLPEAYMSEIDDTASACSDVTTFLIDGLEAASSADGDDSRQSEDAPRPSELCAKPDATGYVVHPADPSAYVALTEVLSKHTPEGMSLTVKRLTVILEDYAANRIRWTRPLGKDGKPRPNRRSVHLADWLAYVERRGAKDNDGWSSPSPGEISEQAAAIRRHRSAGK